MTRVAYLTAGFPWPAAAGAGVRTVAQLKVLSSLPDVEHIRLFSMCENEIRAEDRDALTREVPKIEILDPVFHPIHLFRHPRHVPRVVWLRAVRGVPYMAGKWDSSEVRGALRRMLASEAFDVVWLNGLGIAYYLPLVRSLQPRARVVLDQHNVEHERFVQFAKRQSGLRRIVADAEWRAARRYERDVLRAVDAIGAISQDDARAYREFAGVEARTVPQVATAVRHVRTDAPGQSLCWIGHLAWEPNVRGLNWFCSEIWPSVRESLSEATLEIVGAGLPRGADGTEIVPRAWRVPGVTTRGFVEDLTDVYQRSVAMVAPILGGTGIRIKLVEAFRHGMPVVTTPDGAGGLPIQPGREAFVESAPDAFAARVVDVATSCDLRARLREAGYAFLETHNRLADAQAAVSALLGSIPQQADAMPPRPGTRSSTPGPTPSQWPVDSVGRIT
jgi:glycosyltransferase involved in cell wall biosynthesis